SLHHGSAAVLIRGARSNKMGACCSPRSLRHRRCVPFRAHLREPALGLAPTVEPAPTPDLAPPPPVSSPPSAAGRPTVPPILIPPAEADGHGDPRQGSENEGEGPSGIVVAGLHRAVDGEGHRLSASRYVARHHDGGAELPQRSHERQQKSGAKAVPRQGQRNVPEYLPAVRPVHLGGFVHFRR